MKAQTQIKSKLSSGLAYIGKPEDYGAKKHNQSNASKGDNKNSGAQLRVVNSFRVCIVIKIR